MVLEKLEKPRKNASPVRRIVHTFASTGPLSDSYGPDLDFSLNLEWPIVYPEIANFLHCGYPRSEIIVAESILNVPLEYLQGMDPKGILFTIENRFQVPESASNPGSPILTSFKFFIDGSEDTCFTGVPCEDQEGNGNYVVPLGSSRWVDMLYHLWNRNANRRRVFDMRYPSVSHEELFEEMHELTVESIRRISIIQHIFKPPKSDSKEQNGNEVESPLLTVCWKFNAVVGDSPGHTTCHRVILPSDENRIWYESSMHSELNSFEQSYPTDLLNWSLAPELASSDILCAPNGILASEHDDIRLQVGDAADSFTTTNSRQVPEAMYNSGVFEQTIGGLPENSTLRDKDLLRLDPGITADDQAHSSHYTTGSMQASYHQESSHSHPNANLFYDLGSCLPGASSAATQQVQDDLSSRYATLSNVRTTLQPQDIETGRQCLPLRLAHHASEARSALTPSTSEGSADSYTNDDATECIPSEQASCVTQPMILSSQQAPVPAMTEPQPWFEDPLQSQQQVFQMQGAQQASEAYQQYISMPHVVPNQFDATCAPSSQAAPLVHEHRYETRNKSRQVQPQYDHSHESNQPDLQSQPVLPSQPSPSHTQQLPNQASFGATAINSSFGSLAQRRGLFATSISTAKSSYLEPNTPAPTTAATETFDFAMQHYDSQQPAIPEPDAIASTQSSPGKPIALWEAQDEAMAISEAPKSAQPDFHFGIEDARGASGEDGYQVGVDVSSSLAKSLAIYFISN